MFFASTKRRSGNRHSDASRSYVSLEARRLLALAPLPELTTDVAEFAQTVDDAVVRVDDQRLIIRTTGESNLINIRLELNYLQVNASFDSLALEIDPSQYSRIILISEGDDVARVSGSDLDAQLHPTRLWVSGDVGPFGSDDLSPIQINGTNFERLEVNDSHLRDAGPFLHTSDNRIRFYGGDGVDRLDMSSESDFAITTSVSLVGDGYHFSSNAFGDLFVSGGGGEDFATLAGTRGFTESSFFRSESANGDDVYFGRDNFSRISNDLWDGRFVDFETQRVDLLSGEDRSNIVDTLPASTFYRVDGQDLVGNFRRIIGSEFIVVNGGDIDSDTLFRPDLVDGVFSETSDEFGLTQGDLPNDDGGDVVDDGEFRPLFEERIPDFLAWRFISFERLVG